MQSTIFLKGWKHILHIEDIRYKFTATGKRFVDLHEQVHKLTLEKPDALGFFKIRFLLNEASSLFIKCEEMYYQMLQNYAVEDSTCEYFNYLCALVESQTNYSEALDSMSVASVSAAV